MTKLTNEVVRETGTTIKDSKGHARTLTVTLEPNENGDRIILRPKGCSIDTFAVSLEDIWKLANAPLNICNDCNNELDKRTKNEGGKIG